MKMFYSMASLLSKFRIDYTDLTVIPDITKKAENQTKAFFDSLIKNFKDDPETAGTFCSKPTRLSNFQVQIRFSLYR